MGFPKSVYQPLVVQAFVVGSHISTSDRAPNTLMVLLTFLPPATRTRPSLSTVIPNTARAVVISAMVTPIKDVYHHCRGGLDE